MATTTFRSRIPTVIAHGEYDGLTGGCCLPDGSKIMASYVECAVQKGLFRGADDLSEVTCPQIGRTGCCCACSHLSEDEKDVFKTAMEIDQRWVIEHAADRQNFIDQAQSLNLFFRPDVNIMYLHAVHFLAWKRGLKTLYYCRSEKLGKADRVSKRIEREVIKELDMSAIAQGNECLACEG